MRPEVCPSLEELSSLADGTASSEQAEVLLEHIEHCPSCAATLAKIETRPNTFVRAAAGDPHRTWQLASQDSTPPADRNPSDTPPPDAGRAETARQAGVSCRFTKLRHHAKGGLGQVSIARDEELHREVALKEIQSRHADHPRSRQRFLREAEITGSLEHPGIVPVYSLGAFADGRPYYAMRMIQGESLSEAIDRFHTACRTPDSSARPAGNPYESVEFRKLLGRFVAVCQAMEYAHRRGILHRDLKPANIMVGAYGETLVVDWGLAKAIGAQSASAEDGSSPLADDVRDAADLTQAGTPLGTPAYMSPEQAAGHSRQLTPASDIYSLGATLYSLLTGRRAFDGKDAAEIIDRVKAGVFPPPRQAAPQVPRALEAICLTAMSLAPQSRHPSCAALADDLERYLADQAVACCPESWATRARRWGRRHRALVASAAVGGVVLLIAMAGGLALAAQHNRQLEDFNTKLLDQTNRAHASAHALRSRAATHEFESGNLWLASRLLQQQKPTGEDPIDRRGWEWRYLQQRLDASLRRISTDTEPFDGVFGPHPNSSATTCLAVHPDGKLLAAAEYGGRVRVFQVADGALVKELTVKTGTSASAVAFTPDGKLLIAGGGDLTFEKKEGWLVAWDVGSWELTKQFAGHGEVVTCVAVHPEGQLLASGSRDKTLRIWNIESQKSVRTVRTIEAVGPGDVRGIAFSPDGSQLAACGTDNYVRLWNTADGKLLREFFEAPGGADCVAFTPDGRMLVVGCSDGVTRQWDVSSGSLAREFRGHTGSVTGVAIHRDGRLSTTGRDGSIRQWDVSSGTQVRKLQAHNGQVRDLLLEPSQWRLFTGGDDGIAVWDAHRDVDIRGQASFCLMTGAVVFFPGGKRVAYPVQNGFSIWDLESGQILAKPGVHALPVVGMAVSRDGSMLATSSYGLGDVKVFETTKGRELRSIQADTMLSQAVAFSPDGQWLATCGFENHELRFWNLTDSAQDFGLAKVEGGYYSSLAFHPRDGLLVCGGVQEEIHVFDVAQKQVVWNIPDQITTLRISFVEDGNRMLTAGADGRVRIWDWHNRKMLHEYAASGTGYDDSVGVAYSPEGPRVFVGAADAVRLFDLNTDLEVFAISLPQRVVMDIATSEDGQRLAVLTQHEVRIYEPQEPTPDRLRQREARSLAGYLAAVPIPREQLTADVEQGKWAVEQGVLKAGLELLKDLPDDPVRFNNFAWLIAQQPGQLRDAYEQARDYVREALETRPDDSQCLNTLGVCEFRLGNYEIAAEALEKSKKANAQVEGLAIHYHPSDVAFLAMTYHRLGNAEKAQANLRLLRVAMARPDYKSQRECRAFLAEAEALLGQFASPATP